MNRFKIILILIIASQISLSCNEKVDKKEKIDLTTLVNNWNKAHSSKDIGEFSKLYSDSVFYYGKVLSKNECIQSKLDLFKKYPDFYQQLFGEVQVDSFNLYFKTNFIKRVTFDLKTKDYPSYLEFKKINNKWKIITEGDLVTDKNLAKRKKRREKEKLNIENTNNGVKGDFNGDGEFEYVTLELPTFPENPTEDEFMTCIGECDSFLKFSKKELHSIKIENCIGGEPVNEGDLNNDGTDEIGISPHWWTSCWGSYKVYTFKNGKWKYFIDPISTHCNTWTENFKPIEKDPNIEGHVIIRNTIWSDDNDIVLKTKSIPVN